MARQSGERFDSTYILDMERRLAGGEDPALPDVLPETLVRSSPWLSLAVGERMMRDGQLRKAVRLLGEAVKGFGRLANEGEFVRAMAVFSLAALRGGARSEAETALRFLQAELAEGGRQPKAPPEASLALAAGWPLLHPGKENPDLFLAAADGFLEGGDARRAAEALIDMRLFGHPMDDQRFNRRRVRLTRLLNGNPLEEAAFRLLLFMRGEEATPADAAGDGDVPRGYGELGRLLVAERAVGSGKPVSGPDRRWLRRASKRDDGDLLVLIRICAVLAELEKREGDGPAAGRTEELARAYRDLLGLPVADRLLERMATAQPHGVRSSAGTARGQVRIAGFGGLTLTREDRRAALLRPKRKKSLELLLFLLLRPRYAAPKELVGEELFGDAEPGKMANRMYVTLHDLKRALSESLGLEDAVELANGILRLKEECLESFDVETFVTLNRVADQLWASERDLALDMYARACEMYAEVVPELQYVDWLDRVRDGLSLRQEQALRKLALSAEESGEREGAERYLRQWLEIAPLREEPNERYLRLLAAQGRSEEAREWAARLEAAMRNEWDAAPSETIRRHARKEGQG